jgi:N-acetylmuramoyl-L-alanine amidase
MSKWPIRERPLPYVALLPERAATAVRLVVVHCTELPDLQTARAYGERILHPSGTGNSGHYYVDRDGSIEAYVPGTRSANHVVGHNADSIGIELVNLGRFPHWWDSRHQEMTEPYPATQIAALRQLLFDLRAQFPNLQEIAGHEDLDTRTVAASDDASRSVRRKLDPGRMFPWSEALRDSSLVRITPAHG